jgi:dCTP deaminase
MSVLSDHALGLALDHKQLLMEPRPLDIEPASIDLHLGDTFLTLAARDAYDIIDPKQRQEYDTEKVPEGNCYILMPLSFALGGTVERIGLSRELAAQVDGKSSFGRMGLFVHCTAGWIDPGFQGTLTLEFFNATTRPIKLWPLMPIAQLVVHRLSGTADYAYNGRYARSDVPIGSKGVKAHASA